MLHNLIDSYLVFRLKVKRDPEAFARLYDRYVGAIYRFVFLKLPTKEEAQDVTAETFTKAWQYICDNHSITNMRALLYRIARNLIADHYRRAAPAPLSMDAAVVTFQADAASSILERLEHQISDGGQGRELIEARADIALLLKQFDRLKEDYRDVLSLRLIDELPFQDIANVLEKKTGHVRVIYHRALKALKEFDTDTPL